MNVARLQTQPAGGATDSLELGRRLMWLGGLLGVMLLQAALVVRLAPKPSLGLMGGPSFGEHVQAR